VPLAPFEPSEGWVETSIRLDIVDLPQLSEIENRTFVYPTNPEPGYIDGGIHLRDVHNPVDVTELAFRSWQGGSDRGQTAHAVLLRVRG